jgi:hypothetical protein
MTILYSGQPFILLKVVYGNSGSVIRIWIKSRG